MPATCDTKEGERREGSFEILTSFTSISPISPNENNTPIKRKLSYLLLSLLSLPLLTLLILYISTLLATSVHPPCNANDLHWIPFKQHSQLLSSPTQYPQYHTFYLPMSDGIQIAIDLYLPHSFQHPSLPSILSSLSQSPLSLLSSLPSLPSLPTFIHFTRYSRSVQVRFPFSLFSLFQEKPAKHWNMWTNKFAQSLIANDYLFFSVDVRGTGASHGNRPIDLSHQEVQDMTFIVDFIRQLPFVDKEKIATGGLSYDGMLGLQVASEVGDAVKSVISLFSPMSVYADVMSPGGILSTAFLDDYQKFTESLEKRGTIAYALMEDKMVPKVVSVPVHLLIEGSNPVCDRRVGCGREDEKERDKALSMHGENWDMREGIVERIFDADDTIIANGREYKAGEFGMHQELVRKLYENDVSLFVVGGFYDSGSVRGSLRIFDELRKMYKEGKGEEKNRSQLILGPWVHSARRNNNPFDDGSFSCMESELYNDVVRFLDCRLKGFCWGGAGKEPPVHVYRQREKRGEERRGEERRGDMNRACLMGNKTLFCPTLGKALGRNLLALVPPTSSITPVSPMSLVSPLHLSLNESVFGEKQESVWSHGHAWPPLGTEYKTLFLSDQVSTTVYHNERAWRWGSVLDGLFQRTISVWDFGKILRNKLRPLGKSSSFIMKSHSHQNHSSIDYTSNLEHTTGDYNRWNLVHHVIRMNVDNGNRLDEDNNVLSFEFEAPTDIEVTGSVWISLMIEIIDPQSPESDPSTAEERGEERRGEERKREEEKIEEKTKETETLYDLSLFGYLEDVNPLTYHSFLITEGQVLLSHQLSQVHSLHSNNPQVNSLLSQISPANNEKRGEERRGETLTPGNPNFLIRDYTSNYRQGVRKNVPLRVDFLLEPTSYQIKKDHLLRISLATVDKGNFLVRTKPQWRLAQRFKVDTEQSFVFVPLAN